MLITLGSLATTKLRNRWARTQWAIDYLRLESHTYLSNSCYPSTKFEYDCTASFRPLTGLAPIELIASTIYGSRR